MSKGFTRELRDIEALRAVAVLCVFCQHANLLFPRGNPGAGWPALMSGGWVGVDLFFVISGFVIARSFLPSALSCEQWQGYRTLTFRFWVKRIYRLLPSAWAWLLIILSLAVFYNRSGVFGSVETNLSWTLAGMLNYSNYLFVQYFGSAKPGASFVYWSLSLEEQFYLLFPIAVYLFRRHLVWFLLILILYQLPFSRGLYGMMFRTDALAIGILLAIATRHFDFSAMRNLLGIWPARLLSVILVLALVFVGSLSQQELSFRVGAVAAIAGAIVFIACGDADVLAGRGRWGSALVWLGHRSYAFYLIHIPVIFFMRETAFRTEWALESHRLLSVLAALLLIIVLSALNYRWLESPLRERGRRVAARLGEKTSPTLARVGPRREKS